MPSIFNPTRLDFARRRRGLTKAGLAQSLGLSVGTISEYENGKSVPSENTLARIATLLHFPSAFFFGPTLEEPPDDGVSFRAMTRLTARLKEQAKTSGGLAMQLSDWIHDRFSLPDPNVPTYSDSKLDPEMAGEAVRAEWGLGEEPTGNVIHLLEAHGVRVYSLSEDTVEMDAFSFWRGDLPYIFLNTMKSAERSRMDAAHELGHLVLHGQGGAHGREAEKEALQFGSAFLMPRGSVRAYAPQGADLDDLVEAKRYWNVSVANLTYRMRVVEMLTEWQARMLFVEMGQLGYRTSEPNASPGETSQVMVKVFESLREDGVTMSEVARQLTIWPDELSRSIFGLTLTPILGGGGSGGNPATPPRLTLVPTGSSGP